MELLDIKTVSESLGIPLETLSGYGKRFVLYVPSVRTGALVRYPDEGVRLLGEIHDAVLSGVSLDEIERSLQAYFPLTIVSPAGPHSLPGNPPLDDPAGQPLIGDEDDMSPHEFGTILATLRDLPTAAQIRELREETASLRASLSRRADLTEPGRQGIDSELQELSLSLRREIAELRAELHAERSRRRGTLPGSNGSESHGPAPSSLEVHDAKARVPRRMGQPFRPHGSHHP